MKEARLRKSARQDKNEDNVEFEDQDLAFEKDLEKVGVVVRDLKQPMKKCGFQCWLTYRQGEEMDEE